jgi:hypothetical protein
MKPDLKLIITTTLKKQYWPATKATIVTVFSTDVVTISKKNELGQTSVTVYTPFGPVTINI